MATTTNRYLVYPVLASGPNIVTGGSAWVWTAWVELVPVNTITAQFYISAFSTLLFPTAAVDTRHQTNFSIGKGAAASEVEIIQFSASWLIDTAAGYAPNWYFTLPEPVSVAANTRIAIRAAHSAAAASTFGGCKLQYQIV